MNNYQTEEIKSLGNVELQEKKKRNGYFPRCFLSGNNKFLKTEMNIVIPYR
jgi:hypothetical protein